MSKVVDERVVEMRFDNSNFESNARATMSTLDKLKAALKFPSKTDALSDLAAGAKNVSSRIGDTSSAVGTLSDRFSALQVMGVTALANITNQAVNAGKRIASALTINPIQAGFQEYETQLNAVQTILANTESKGSTIDDVNAALDELNKYADLTIYNFTEMTRNIGTFTAAGVGLEESVNAIKGIANLAAVSGSTSAQASTAMYQLSQALATGKVSLMDWNSVVNAGMGGEVFQTALKRTAKNMGTDVDALIEKYGSFRETLTKEGWLTADVLTETLSQIAGAYDEAELRSQGYSDAEIQDILKLAQTATDAATKVKTFTQLMDTLGEALGSGWTKTFQLIFGDFEEARGFWTQISDTLSNVINQSSDARNNLLQGALDSSWSQLSAQLENAGIPLDDFTNKLSELDSSYGGTISGMIAEGKTWEEVASSGAITSSEVIETLKQLSGSYEGSIDDLSDAQLESIGYSKDQIKALRDLADQAEQAGTPINELINTLDRPSGRELIFTSIKNVIQAVMNLLKPFSDAWNNVFNIDSGDIYDAVSAFEKFTESLILDQDTIDDLTDVLEALFSVLKVIGKYVGGAFVKAFSAIANIASTAAKAFLKMASPIGKIVKGFADWADGNISLNEALENFYDVLTSTLGPLGEFVGAVIDVPGVFDAAASAISNLIAPIKNYIATFQGLNLVQIIKKLVSDIKGLFKGITWDDVLKTVSNFGVKFRDKVSEIVDGFKEIGPDIIAGLGDGIKDAIENLVAVAAEIATKLIEIVKAFLGIHSPSTVFFEIGKNVIEGLVNGIKYGIDIIADLAKYLVDKLTWAFSSVDWEAVFTVASGVGLFVILYKVATALNTFAGAIKNITNPLSGLNNMFGGVTNVLKSFSKYMNEKKWTVRADAVKTLAISVGILAAAVILLSKQDIGAIKDATGVIIALSVALGVLVLAINNFDGASAFDSATTAGTIASVAALVGVMGIVMGTLAGLSTEGIQKGLDVVSMFSLIIMALMGFTSYVGKAKQLSALPKVLLSIAAVFLGLAQTLKMVSGMSVDQAQLGVEILDRFTLIIVAIMAVSKVVGNGKQLSSLAKTLSSVAGVFAAMALVTGLLGKMKPETIAQGLIGITYFTLIIVALMAATRLASPSDVSAAGKMVLEVAAAMGILALVARIISGMSFEEMGKAAVGIAGLGAIVEALVYATKKIGGGEVAKIGATMLGISVAIGILGLIATLLSNVEIGALAKGIIAVGALSAMVALMAAATRGASDVKGSMMGIAAAIAVLAIAVVALSFIDTEKLVATTASLSVAMLGLAAVIKAMSAVKVDAGIVSTVAIMAAVLLGVTGVIAILSTIDATNTLPNAVALSALLLAVAGACKILDTVKSVSTSAIATIAVITAVMYALSGVIYIIAGINPQNVLPNVVALSALLLALSAATAILGTIKSDISLGTVGTMAALTLCVAALAGVIYAIRDVDPASAIPNVIALGSLLAEMTVITAIIKKLNINDPIEIGKGALAIDAVTAVVGAMVALVGVLNEITSGGLADVISSGAEVLQALGDAIGSFIGGIIGGIAGGIMDSVGDSLANFGLSLSQFMVNLTPFLMGLKLITPDMLTAIDNLVDAILTITAANIIDGIASFITGGTDFVGFGVKLGLLGAGIAAFAGSVSSLDASTLTKVSIASQAAKALGEMAANLPKQGGLASGIFGSTEDMSTFGDSLEDFGKAMSKYAKSVDGLNTEAINASIPAAQSLVELSKTLPESDSLKKSILGGTDTLGNFGTNLQNFGDSLSTYATSVQNLDTEAINNSIPAAQALVDLSKTLPDAESFAATIFGGKQENLGDFATNVQNFGSGLSSYSDSVANLNTEKITESVTAAQAIAELAKTLPDANSWAGTIFGGNKETLGSFGSQMTSLATGIANFANKMANANLDKLNSGVDAVKSLIQIMKQLDGWQSADLSGFNDNLSHLDTISEHINTFCNNIKGVDVGQLSGSISGLNGLKDFLIGLNGFDGSGVDSFVNAVAEIATADFSGISNALEGVSLESVGQNLATSLANGFSSGMSKFLNAVNDVLTKARTAITKQNSTFKNLGKTLGTNLANGIKSSSGTVTSAVKTICSNLSGTIRGYYSSFSSAGKYLGQGLANGLSSMTSTVRSKASQLASAAASAVRVTAQIRSPSKVWYKLGSYMGQGLVNALSDYGSVAYNAGESVSDSAVNGLTKGISRIADEVNSGLDVNPTIRPVMDLSDIERGVDYLNSALNGTKSYSVLGQVGRIARGANSNLQNGTTDDVIKAINRLRTDIQGMPVNQYTVNGITYDDGSAISGAVKQLIRTTRIERRI